MTEQLERYPQTWEGLLEQMDIATRQAVEDAQQHKKQHRLTEGRVEQAGSSGFRYSFLLHDEWEPGANTSILIEVDPDNSDTSIAGSVLSVLNARVTLVMEAPLPDALLEQVVLVEATVWLLQRLQQAILRIQSQQDTDQSIGMGKSIVGLLPTRQGRDRRQLQMASFTPDADQARAIEIGLASEQVLVIGPPGSGKTSVESVLAAEYLYAGKTVLVVAPTNVALDTLMLRLKEYAQQSGQAVWLEEHAMVRCGKTTTLVGESYQQLVLQGIVDQKMGTLARERDQVQQDLLHHKEQFTTFIRTAQVQRADSQREHDRRQQQLDTALTRRTTLEHQETERKVALMTQRRHAEDELKQKWQQQREIDEQKKEVQLLLEGAHQYCRQLQQEGQELVERIQALRARSAVGRLLARIGGTSEQSLYEAFQQKQNEYKQSYERLTIDETEYRDIVKARDALRISIETLSQEVHRLSLEHQRVTPEAQEIASLNTQIDDERAAIRAYEQHIATLDADEQQLRRHGDLLQGRLDEIEQAQGQIVGEVMNQARLIGITLAGLTTNPFLRDRLFDAVLLDEASMASLVHAVVAATHARSHVAVFGDPLQLAPVIQVDATKSPHASYWLGTNLFTYCQVTLQESTTQHDRVVLLSQQSRMHERIAEPISRFIYQGRLHNRLPRQAVIEPLAPHPEWPFMLIDTGDVDRGKAAGEARLCRASRPLRSSSKVNRYHVACIVQLVRLLAAQSPIREQKGSPRIGIITPYGAQKAALRRALQEEHLLQFAQVATLHGVQSAEFACVIFDTTEGYGVPIGRFTSSSWGQHDIPHSATCLLNVAHSRAQEKLIYLANVDYIHADAYRRAHLLTRLVDAAAASGCMDSSQLFENYGTQQI